MKAIRITIPIGLGDLIYTKAMFDSILNHFSEIRIKFHREIIEFYKINHDYNKFLDEMGALLFSNPPYVLTSESGIPFYGLVTICQEHNITPTKPNLSQILCKGESLNLGEEYIAIATKSRYLDRQYFDQRAPSFWQAMNKIAQKYKIVILGEKVVEFNSGYAEMGSNAVYSIYNDIMNNLPHDRLIDLTVPALGQTAPQLLKIQQDCLIMNEAKYVITLGIGGGFCMATAVSKYAIGFRIDQDPIADVVFNRDYPDAIITKDWDRFLRLLDSL